MKSSSRPLLTEVISHAGAAHMHLRRLDLTNQAGTKLVNEAQVRKDLFRVAVLEAEALVAKLKKIAASEY